MSDAIRYEIARLRTLRSTWWLLGISLVVTAGIAALVSQAARSDVELTGAGRGLAIALSAGAQFSGVPLPPVLVGLVGAFSMGHEYRYGTIRPTLIALPRRQSVLAAKVLVVSAWALLLAVVHLAVAYLVCVVYPGQELTTGAGWEPAGRVAVGFAVLMVLWSLVGLALGGLTRNMPAAIVILLVVPLVVESVVFGLLVFVDALEPLRWMTSYLPFSAGQALVTVISTGDFAIDGVEASTPLEGGIVFGVFTLLLLTATSVLFSRRDA